MGSFVRQSYQVLGLAYYHLFLGPRGRGRPAGTNTWDAQYLTGHWDHFTTLDEMPRYAVIASYIRHRPVAPSVLDVGCGYGQLTKQVDASSVERYLGIDVSSAAIDRANLQSQENVSFEVGNFEEWHTDAKFDLIVFNDTLYYARHPIAVLDRYAAMLSDGGMLIVAMYRHRNTMVIWRNIAKRFGCIDRVEVRNGKGELTDVRVLQPSHSRAAPNGSHASLDSPQAAIAAGSASQAGSFER
jgi:2-polyprenyl-6-hydroxyphenyl methylase/3-demethylubiquinone-9 3-methyltransferase